MDMSYKKKKTNYVSSNISNYREPLQIQTLRPKKYLKYSSELQSDNGHMLPILTNFKVIHHTLTY